MQGAQLPLLRRVIVRVLCGVFAIFFGRIVAGTPLLLNVIAYLNCVLLHGDIDIVVGNAVGAVVNFVLLRTKSNVLADAFGPIITGVSRICNVGNTVSSACTSVVTAVRHVNSTCD